MKKLLQKRKLIPLIAALVVTVCVVTTVCVFAEKEKKTMNESPKIGEPISESVSEPAAEPITEPPTEPPTEAPTEPITESPTEPATEAPTEAPTEPPTEAPAEPQTEPVTQPVTPENITIKTRDTMLEGETVIFDKFERSGYIIEPTVVIDKTMTDLLEKTGRRFVVIPARSRDESLTAVSTFWKKKYIDKSVEYNEYDDSYFENYDLIYLFEGGIIDNITKNGNELCIALRAMKCSYTDGGNRPGVVPETSFDTIVLEKKYLNDVDTISLFVDIIDEDEYYREYFRLRGISIE